jgi:hypothetical protein
MQLVADSPAVDMRDELRLVDAMAILHGNVEPRIEQRLRESVGLHSVIDELRRLAL